MEWSDLPDGALIDKLRSLSLSDAKGYKIWDKVHDGSDPLNLKELAFAFPSEIGVRQLAITNGGILGVVTADSHFASEDPVCEYASVILCDSTTFEMCTLRDDVDCTYVYHNGKLLGLCLCVEKSKSPRADDRTEWGHYYVRMAWELYKGDEFFGRVHTGNSAFGGRIYFKYCVTRDSLQIERQGHPNLPIHLAGKDKIMDIPKAIFRLLTLYPLWSKKSPVGRDRVIPMNAPALTDDEETAFYFAINVVFRVLFIPDIEFDSGGGD